MTDTRSGRALVAAIVVATAGRAGLEGRPPVDRDVVRQLQPRCRHVRRLPGPAARTACRLLAMTSEWTQRTALSTFTLAPRRLPVIAAKYVGVVGISVAMLAVGLVMAVAATAIGGAIHGPADFGGVPATSAAPSSSSSCRSRWPPRSAPSPPTPRWP